MFSCDILSNLIIGGSFRAIFKYDSRQQVVCEILEKVTKMGKELRVCDHSSLCSDLQIV